MSKVATRLREPLSTIDKRLVTGVGLSFAIVYALIFIYFSWSGYQAGPPSNDGSPDGRGLLC